MAYGYLSTQESVNDSISDNLIREGAFAKKWTRYTTPGVVEPIECMKSTEGCEKFTLYLQVLNRVKL